MTLVYQAAIDEWKGNLKQFVEVGLIQEQVTRRRDMKMNKNKINGVLGHLCAHIG